jgi:hypothetical protein
MNADFSKRWQQPGDEAYTNVPSMIYPLSNSRRDDFYAGSEVNVLKGDNIRLQYIRLSWELSNNQNKRLPYRNLTLYANAENLGILWRANKEGLDPDYGRGNAAYPPPKRFAIGIKADF